MRRKPQFKPEPVIAPEIIESAKRSLTVDRAKAPVKCVVCNAETPAGAAEHGFGQLVQPEHPQRRAELHFDHRHDAGVAFEIVVFASGR